MQLENDRATRGRLVAKVGERRLGSTRRTDNWWLEPATVALGLGLFGAYATWAAFTGTDYQFGSYLSPFYSPLISLPNRVISPALLVLWAPLGFRLTCYYYRKAYYRAFFLSPPACAVSETPHTYRGEAGVLRWLPIVHRWFLYASILVLAVLWYDAARSFEFGGRFGVGLGSVVLLLNVCFLTFFTFGCHAFRNLIGGSRRCFTCVSKLTATHPIWAWISLYSVGVADLYIRLLSLGIVHDPHVIF